MKKKKKHTTAKKKSEFRFHKVETINRSGKTIIIEHPAFIFIEKGNVYLYVVITHSNHVRDLILIKLRKNPNPKDKRDSYVVNELKEDTKDKFGKKKKGWKIDILDEEMIREKYEKR